jgi:hypothetical protein
MNICVRPGGRLAAGALVLISLVVLNGPLRAASGLLPTAAHADGILFIGKVCDWEAYDWDEMSSNERQAWQILGWNRALWDSDNSNAVPSSSKDWSELTVNERKAARGLGFTPQTWEIACPPTYPEPEKD